MNITDLYSLFLLGLVGTGHCIGMCGPLVFAFPARMGTFAAHLLYHLGRIGTYTAVGGLLGLLGSGLAHMGTAGSPALDRLSLIQVCFALAAALFLLFFGISRLGLLREPGWMSLAEPSRIPGYGKIVTAVRQDKRPWAIFVLGLIMGFLPCGLSFGAFARALPTTSAVTGAAMLLAFGLGTLPGLLLLGTGASGIFQRYRRASDILAGLLMIAMALRMSIKAIGKLIA